VIAPSESTNGKVSIQDILVWAKNVLSEEGWPDPENEQTSVHLWFRGNTSTGHDLVPTIFRIKQSSGKTIARSVQDGYIRHRLKNVNSVGVYEEGGLLSHLTKRIPDISSGSPSTLDILSLLRHYELPSRLLDWTENVFVALWMAVQDDDKGARDGEIFALNARELAKEIDFPHKARSEPPVYGAGNIHVNLRAGMALTSYLDELFSLAFVREAALNEGFSSRFWDHLLNIVSELTDAQISQLEDGEHPRFFYDFDALYNEMPPLMQQSFRREGEYSNKDNKDQAALWFYKFLSDLRKPVAVFPERKNIRLIAQSGMFTLSGGDYLPKKVERNGVGCRIPNPLHLNRGNKRLVASYTIPHSSKKELRKDLEMIGFHAANIFPELESQGKYIKNFWYVKVANSGQSNRPDLPAKD
jgi:hypothetical protein